ncbi:WD domain [Trypanosoma vivax]|uniref:Uncharacterized protein n=1 Tax=Trypanosoma vivax (strain Y486) TaxID=1055687 RepID=G0TZ78_TRYVY|nr:hypothetical protein TRVL_05982 [Trypanosoma vivax]KAH8613068.1 WD domain [Trypanosoma vivax]CCC49281.1 conserved hypothetical protein [Trypanosoma vivax Y486]
MDATSRPSSSGETSASAQHRRGAAISIPNATLVEFDGRSDTIRGELIQVIVRWLLEQGLTSSAQLLSSEAAALFRNELNERKTLRDISRAIQEGNWDVAHNKLKKLDSLVKLTGAGGRGLAMQQLAPLLRSLPFLLAQQQFLEYVDEDDGQRAHHFFMREIKPLEGAINRDHFQRLVYLLTCHAVSEAGASFPEWRSWTPMKGRLQLKTLIERAIGFCDTSPYCREYEYGSDEGQGVTSRSLEQILAGSLSYELLVSQHPALLSRLPVQKVFSILRPLSKQLLPSHLMMSMDVNKLLSGTVAQNEGHVRPTTCQPFLQVPAVVVGTDTGSVVWIPLQNEQNGAAFAVENASVQLYQYTAPVRGMVSHKHRLLLSWSGHQAVVINVAQFISSFSSTLKTKDYLTECVANTFSHPADVRSACLFPCGCTLATGLSEGTVTVWDLHTGTQMFQHGFSTSSIESLIVSQSGNCYFAASREGLIRAVDVATGVLLFTFAPPISSELSSIAVSPSSSILLASYKNGTLRMWDVLTGSALPHRFEGHESDKCRSTSATFGCIDSHIITGHDNGCLYLWNSTHIQFSHQQRHVETPPAADVAPQYRQGNLLVFNSPNELGKCYWPVASALHPQTCLRLHRSSIVDVKFHDGYAVTCGSDGLVCICGNVHRDTPQAE